MTAMLWVTVKQSHASLGDSIDDCDTDRQGSCSIFPLIGIEAFILEMLDDGMYYNVIVVVTFWDSMDCKVIQTLLLLLLLLCLI